MASAYTSSFRDANVHHEKRLYHFQFHFFQLIRDFCIELFFFFFFVSSWISFPPPFRKWDKGVATNTDRLCSRCWCAGTPERFTKILRKNLNSVSWSMHLSYMILRCARILLLFVASQPRRLVYQDTMIRMWLNAWTQLLMHYLCAEYRCIDTRPGGKLLVKMWMAV